MTETTTVRTKAELLRLLEDGWELGIDSGIHGYVSIQKGGIGFGGESRNVARNLPYKPEIWDRLELSGKTFPVRTYRLRAAALAQARNT